MTPQLHLHPDFQKWGQADYDQAVTLATAAANAYYNTATLLTDDDSYDALIAAISAYEHQHQLPPSDLTTQVAGGVGTGTVTHPSPMLSLGNAFTTTDLENWAKIVTTHNPNAGFTAEAKLDGLALSAIYHNGQLQRVATRGDGLKGEDVTSAANDIVGLPPQLTAPASLEIRGEVVLTAAQFQQANHIRQEHNDPIFTNARSGAAGALRGAARRHYALPLTFFAYSAHKLKDTDLVHGHDLNWLNQSDVLRLIEDLGVKSTASTPCSFLKTTRIPQVQDWITNLAEKRATLGIDIDGVVVKVEDGKTRVELGETARAPRGAIAWKFPAATTISTLEEVTWQVGRTGVITPRARITPVSVGGVTVTYASLHNPDDISRKGFKLFDQVTVLRAGDVVPRLQAPIVEAREAGKQLSIPIPTNCPQCESPIDKSEARWRCERGRACGLVASLVYAAGRPGWDIDGLGDQTAKALVTGQLVETVADIFTLTTQDLLTLPGYSTLRAQNLLTQIKRAAGAPFANTLTALGIRGTGQAVSKRLALQFPTFAHLYDATVDDFQQVEGIGQEKAEMLRQELHTLRPVVTKLMSLNIGVAPASETHARLGPEVEIFAGENIVVTGAMTGELVNLSRGQLQELLETLGARVQSGVTKKTTLVIAGAKAGSKLVKAQQLNIPVLSPEQLATRLPDGWQDYLP